MDFEGAGNPSKQLLQTNLFSPLPLDNAGNPPKKGKKQQSQLPQVQPERKEKCPPVFVKGDPPDLRPKIRQLIAKGLTCTFRLCSEGVKVHKYEFYTHDLPGTKPLKALLRGLHDMKKSLSLLESSGLKPIAVHKIARHDKGRKYRDQLYLVHLEHGSISSKNLKLTGGMNYTVRIF